MGFTVRRGMGFSKLSIRQDDASPHRTQVLLNGERVPGLRAVKVECAYTDATIATLELFLDELTVDAETLVYLNTVLAGQQPETRPTIAAPLPGDE